MRQALGWEGRLLGYYAKTLLSEKIYRRKTTREKLSGKNYQGKTISQPGWNWKGCPLGILRTVITISFTICTVRGQLTKTKSKHSEYSYESVSLYYNKCHCPMNTEQSIFIKDRADLLVAQVFIR